MRIESIDHLVLTVSDVDASIAFYTSVLGMKTVTFGQGRHALTFGPQKINLHQVGHEFEPEATAPKPGSADLCFLTAEPLDRVLDHFSSCGITVIEGPVMKTGAPRTLDSPAISHSG